MSDTALQGVQDLLMVALDEISALLGTPDVDMNSQASLEACQLQIENTGMAAAMAGLSGVQTLCELYLQRVAEKWGTDILPENVLEWLFSLSGYLQDADVEKIASLLMVFDGTKTEVLLDLLSEDQKIVERLLAQDVPVDAAEEFFGEEDFDDVNFSAESYKSVDVINMFLAEFVDVSDRMKKLIATIVGDASFEEIDRAMIEYLDLLDRVILTSETLGLNGLRAVCLFVRDNTSMVAGLGKLEVEVRESIRTILGGWHKPVIDYLKMPEDDSACIALVSYLEGSHWPDPLKYDQSQEILVSLIRELEGLEQGDSNSYQSRGETAAEADVALMISEDASEAMIAAFFQESPGLAVEFSSHIEKLAAGEDVQANTESAQRIAHTLKGSANLIGATGIANLTHHIEDILEFLARNAQTPPAQLAATLQESADTIEAMIEALQGVGDAPDDAVSVLQAVLDWANRIDQGNVDINTSIEVREKKSGGKPEPDVEAPKKVASEVNQAESLHVPVTQVDEMFRLVGEMSIAMGQMQEQIRSLIQEGESLNNQDLVVQQRRFELENLIDVKNVASRQRRLRHAGVADTHFDSLEMDEYDEVHGAVHSYIETVADSRSIGRELALKSHVLDGLLAQQSQLYSELQQIIMGTRMVSVSSIVARLQRSVRQACRATGKQAQLVIRGDELQMDGDVLSRLTAPLMHMLRNAIDHGIEEAEEREIAGKDPQGTITLEFRQQGNQVVVNCLDDGRGLDLEKIRETAEQRGMIVEGQSLSRSEIARLILHPGFTTRTTATQISGRGVGMDVVNTTIGMLKGILTIDDEVKTGSRFVMSLPITLVTNHSVLAKVEGELYAIPTSSLVQILTPGIGDYGKIGDTMTYQLNDEIYPAHYFRDLYKLAALPDSTGLKGKYTLLVRSDIGTVAVAVDNVINSYELVVKDMGRYVKSVRGVAGISVLGSGDVIPVIDLAEQLRSDKGARGENRSSNVENNAQLVHVPRVLVVDDSLSVRQSLSQLIEDAGFEVRVARDGIEAMDMIREQMPDIVLADMEMPRMNGLELTAAIRNQEETQGLPVIMITSRSMQKHRDEATKAGVSEYMTKPFAEDQLLSNIQTYIAA